MTQRTDERRKNLLTYLNLTVEDLVARNIVKKTDAPGTIVRALLTTFGKEVVEDAKTVVAAYARAKAALAVELGAMKLGQKSGDADFAELLGAGARMISKRISGGK